jgi:hypothetical protein
MCHQLFEVMNSHACVCVQNNLLSICDYDYNINNHFEKGDTSPGANEISWTTPAPLGDYILGVYSKIFLEYFEQKSLKKLF